MYAVLRAHAADGSLPTEQATLFQLDEYVGLAPADERSYRAYLRASCAASASAPSTGSTARRPTRKPSARATRRCSTRRRSTSPCSGSAATDTSRSTSPGSTRRRRGAARARSTQTTRADAAADFGGLEKVPREALTVGLRTLPERASCSCSCPGRRRRAALRAMLEGEPEPGLPGVAAARPPAAHRDLRRRRRGAAAARGRAGRATAP